MQSDLSWTHVLLALGTSGIGIYGIRTTKLRDVVAERDTHGFVYAFRLWVKLCGWVFAIGGILVAVRIAGLLVRG